MKSILYKVLKKAAASANESGLFSGTKPFLKSAIFGEPLPLSSILSNRSFAIFKDEKGNEFNLIERLRDAIKPGWQWVLQPDKNELPDGKKARARLDLANDSIKKALSLLECFGFQAEGKTALEIGCYDGARSFALAEQGIDQVTGSDIARYYVRESDKDPDAAQKKTVYLNELRNAVSNASCQGGAAREKVCFIEDDITESTLPASSFDLICSWEVLEHVQDPAKLFYQINRLLKPGGIAFHEYNPFFAINGGHSWCTLDFLWGHVLLKDREFEKYLARFRPPEMNEALNFYNKSLNRMTMGELERVSAEEGLNTLALIPWTEKEHLELLTACIFRQAKENYPSITAQDLSSPFVWVVQTKS